MEPLASGWHSNADRAPKARFAKFHSNHPREFISLFNNLEKIRGLLASGNKLGGFRVNFFRSEGDQVYRIGQTAVPAAKESRLCVFPDPDTQTIHVLTIGTKETEPKDINEAKDLVKEILKAKQQAKS